MATYYGVNAGGVWTAGATWSTTAAKDETRTGGATAPTSSDTCVLDDYSGNITVSSNGAGLTLNCTGYTNTITINAAITLTISGSITLSATTTISSTTGILSINNNATLTTNGVSVPGKLYFDTAGKTVTLGSALTVTDTLRIISGTTIAGAYNLTCGELDMFQNSSSRTTIFVSGQTLTVTTAINIAGNSLYTALVKSSTATSSTYLTYQGTAANCKIFSLEFTDVDASGSAQVLDNWYGGALTRTSNITNRTSADIGGSGGVNMPRVRIGH
jgi:hypothetical protein